MKTLLLVLSISFTALAADPPYFGELDGYYVAGVESEHKLKFIPGTPEQCRESDVADLNFWNCALKDARLVLETTSKSYTIALSSLHVHKRNDEASFEFQGRYTRTFPNGKSHDYQVHFRLYRNEPAPQKVTGFLQVTGHFDGGVLLWSSR